MEADQSEKTLSPENSINTTKHPLQNRFVHVPKGYVSIFFFSNTHYDTFMYYNFDLDLNPKLLLKMSINEPSYSNVITVFLLVS